MPASPRGGLVTDKRALLVLNPQAGRGRAKRLARPLPDVARSLGWTIEVCETQSAGHEVELAARCKRDGWPVVIAVGGDGTVHGVVNGLLKDGPSSTVLAHVPIGTGNDFAKTVGLNKARHPARNLRSVLTGQVRQLDLGWALNEYFVNGLGVGFAAEVVKNTFAFKRLRGFALYLASVYRTFFSFEASDLEVSAAEYENQGRLLMAEVALGKTTGGGFKLTPEADPTDGLLDVCLVRNISVFTFLRYVPRVLLGTHTNLPPVTIFQTRRVQLTTSSSPITVHLDGELRSADQASLVAEIKPGSLSALCAV